MITSKDFWNMRSRSYDQQMGPLYAQAYEKTIQHTIPYLREGDQVLDFACGTGILTLQMAPHVARVRAIDISDEMVRRAAAKLEANGVDNVELSQTELFDSCLEPESYDVVTAFNVLCYVDDQNEVLSRIRSLLKPGGLFLSATDCRGERPTRVGLQKLWRSRTGAMPYVAFYRMKGLEQAIARAGFVVLERENLFRAPPNLFVAARKAGR